MKKEYIQPTMRIRHIRASQMLCASNDYTFSTIKEDTYTEQGNDVD